MCRLLFVLAFLIGSPAWAQYLVTTVAGGLPPATPSDAASASIGDPPRVTADPSGNVYFTSVHSVFKVDRSGTLTRVAGTGRSGNSGDGGPALAAQMLFPEGIAADGSGNLWVADRDANIVRRISAAGAISTVAGTGAAGFSGDGGPATAARLAGPTGLALDDAGNLYVADTGNSAIRKITPSGIISTVAGTTGRDYDGDGGPATRAVLNGPEGVAFDAAGNLYIADTFNNRIRKVATDGTITTFAANGFPGYGGDNGPATGATLELPTDVAVDSSGNLYIADLGTSRIRKVTNGIISTYAGSTNGEPPFDGLPATAVRLSGPTGVAVDSAGNVYFTEGSVGSGSGLAAGDFKVWTVSTAGFLFTAAGTGRNSFSGDGGPALLSQMDAPAGIALDPRGNLYIADTRNNRVRRISPDGRIATVAGYGPPGFGGDGGPATAALLNQPTAVAVDIEGNLYIADTGNNRIREVLPSGNIGTAAGNGNAAFFGDGGNPLNAALRGPRAIAFDADGKLYIADTGNHRVRKVLNGVIDTVAGRGQGFGGDGDQAVKALLDSPSAIALDSGGNLYIADQGNNRIRMVAANGVIATLVSGLGIPRGIAADRNGAVYFSDAAQNRIFKTGADGAVSAIAGSGQCCYSGDGGDASAASLNAPWGLAVTAAGNLYFADTGNDAIRLLQPLKGVVAGAVTNAASNLAGPIAPGEIVTIYGSGIGPAQPVQFQALNSLGLVGTDLGGAGVLFNGTFGPMLYASANQVTAIVPYGVSGSDVQVAAEYQSRIAFSASVPLAAAAPALFTADSSGKGQALAFNQDGSQNGPAHPAAPGTAITLLATGEGQTTPAGIDGKPAANPAPRPVAPVSVAIGGQPAVVQYAGGEPGAVAGVMQLNVQVPAGLPAGPQAVVLRVGGVTSPDGVAITVAAVPAVP